MYQVTVSWCHLGMECADRHKKRQIRLRFSYQAIKQMMEATNNRVPKPPKIYLMIFLNKFRGGAERAFLPYFLALRSTCAESRPTDGETLSLSATWSVLRVCQSRSASSAMVPISE